MGGAHERAKLFGDGFVVDVAPEPFVAAAYLVQAPPRRQQADHARVGGVDVGEQQQRPDGGLCRVHRKVREGPDRVVEDREVRALERQAACFAYRHLVGGDGLGADDHLEARSRGRPLRCGPRRRHPKEAIPWWTKSRPSLKLRIPTLGNQTSLSEIRFRNPFQKRVSGGPYSQLRWLSRAFYWTAGGRGPRGDARLISYCGCKGVMTCTGSFFDYQA